MIPITLLLALGALMVYRSDVIALLLSLPACNEDFIHL